MRICDDGTYRDMTAEEEAAAALTPEPGSMNEEIDDTEALKILLGGDSE